MAPTKRPRRHQQGVLDPDDQGTDNVKNTREARGGAKGGLSGDPERGSNPSLPMYGGKLPYWRSHVKTRTGEDFGNVKLNSEVDGR